MSAPVRTAIILAAGRGSRLGARGELAPKGFLRLGERPIIEESIARLQVAGVERVVLVTGHLAQHYEGLRERLAGVVETVHNPDYASTGSLRSLLCASPLVHEDVLLLESDLIYEQRALSELAADERPDVVLISGRTQSEDEVWVGAQGDRIVDMSKDRAHLSGQCVGELVGVTRLSAAFLRELMEVAERSLEALPGAEYEAHGLIMAGTRRPLHWRLVEDLRWAEIDNDQHLARARGLYAEMAPPGER